MSEPVSQNDVQQMLDRQTDRLSSVIRDNAGQIIQIIEHNAQEIDALREEIQRLSTFIQSAHPPQQ